MTLESSGGRNWGREVAGFFALCGLGVAVVGIALGSYPDAIISADRTVSVDFLGPEAVVLGQPELAKLAYVVAILGVGVFFLIRPRRRT